MAIGSQLPDTIQAGAGVGSSSYTPVASTPPAGKVTYTGNPTTTTTVTGNHTSGRLRFAEEAENDSGAAPTLVEIVPWRMRERMKTMDVALVLCLNIGTDPPDVVKSSPCARKECWVDPFSMPAQKALETIGKTLQSQYERWQPRARYRQSLDPTVEETKQLCVSLRRHAKHDRVLFHYNGHGVPRPTANGEIWVFNKSYTQYIPLLVYDLQSWVGTPSIYVFDCSAAGILLNHFNNPVPDPNGIDGFSSSSLAGEAIVLAACGANELLPMNPELCADVFTSCLTTPITVALRWFIAQNELSMAHVDASFIERIPGKLTDRKTPLGELNWIFTAITDTIAWNVLPRELFQKLFRQDLLVASLFRNFLLAERIMKAEGCSPCSLPALPSTHHHPLWRSWDLAAETCLNQLYRISNPHPHAELSFQHSRFFAEQLTAFEVWLQFGSSSKPPPQQLPMVLQVLLSQVHRLRALVLLKKFLDLGPWAVNLALSVGIFPYVLKLLQSPATELRHVLVFIWAKILALDPSCQVDLVKDDGHSYFISHLAAGLQTHAHSSFGQGVVGHHGAVSVMPPDQKVMAAFILSVICTNCPQGQKSCLSQYLHKICSNLVGDADENVRMWVCFCLAKLWENFEDAKRIAIEDKVPRLLGLRLQDERPEVRAAAAYALGTLVGFDFDFSVVGKHVDEHQLGDFLRLRATGDIVTAMELLWGCHDASPLVRRESILALANVILHIYHQPRFEYVAKHCKNRGMNKRSPLAASTATPMSTTESSVGGGSKWGNAGVSENAGDRNSHIGADTQVDAELIDLIGEDARYYVQIWYALKEIQSRDPFPKVVNAVKVIVSAVNTGVLASEQEHLKSDNQNAASGSADARTNSQFNRRIDGGPHLQRETSVSDIPVAAVSAHAHGSTDTRGEKPAPVATGMKKSGSRNSVEEVVSSTAGTGMGIRPNLSVGNFRTYQEQYQATAGSTTPQVVSSNTVQSKNAYGAPVQTRHSIASVDGNNRFVGPARHANAASRPGEPNMYKQDNARSVSRYGRQPDFPVSLQSTFYDRHKAKFNLPILEPVSEDDDPLSEKGAEKLDRARRYDRIRKSATKLAPGFFPGPTSMQGLSDRSVPALPSNSSTYHPGMPVPSSPYSAAAFGSVHRSDVYGNRDEIKNFNLNLRQCAVLNNEAEMTSLLLFHPYETMLVAADEKDQISLYNFEQSEKKVLSFGNKNPTGSRLTSLSWINESEESLLTCASDDGVIKIYHGLHTPHPPPSSPKLLSAFVAVPDLVPGTRGSGLITNWQQTAGMLFAGGNSSVLRGWNLRQERCTFTLPTQTDSCITSMASDETTGGMLVAGFGDGTIRLFDPRTRPEYALKMTMKEHTSWIVQTHVYAGRNELLSGSVSGELKFWDLRLPRTSTKSLEAHRSPMTALAVHDYAPIFASGSHNQFIKVFRSDGEQLALIRYHEGFLGERIGPVSCLAFHPHRLFLAAGATDSVVAIYSSDK